MALERYRRNIQSSYDQISDFYWGNINNIATQIFCLPIIEFGNLQSKFETPKPIYNHLLCFPVSWLIPHANSKRTWCIQYPRSPISSMSLPSPVLSCFLLDSFLLCNTTTHAQPSSCSSGYCTLCTVHICRGEQPAALAAQKKDGGSSWWRSNITFRWPTKVAQDQGAGMGKQDHIGLSYGGAVAWTEGGQ